MSSGFGSLAWDADDLDGELCLGAGVGAMPKEEMLRIISHNHLYPAEVCGAPLYLSQVSPFPISGQIYAPEFVPRLFRNASH